MFSSLLFKSTSTSNFNNWIQCRFVHSNTQLKRIFHRHPARRRVEARLDITPRRLPLKEPKFEPIGEPVFLPNGWNEPLAAEIPRPDYPFMVQRTKNKPKDAVGFLPVYSKHRYV
jgi:hypothetical protein